MSASLLASASTVVKVWDISTNAGSTKLNGNANSTVMPEQLFGVELASFAPKSSSTIVNAVRWNHDNQQLAVVGNKGALTIHDSRGNLLETIPFNNDTSETPDVNAIHFANKSRYVLYGGSDKVVNIWDRKYSTFTDALKGHRSNITCIDLNIDETIVASSNSGGNILVHNRQKSNAWDSLTVPTKQPINVLAYSFFKRGLLAAGGKDGSLRLWDTSTSTTALQTFENSHHSEIKGMAFSPSNSQLLCSVGLDTNIVFYDVGKKSTLKVIYTDSPLTALGFKADGLTIVAGTQQGRILVYDLRSTIKPTCTLSVHESCPIRCLHFQEKARSPEARPTTTKRPSHNRTSSKGTIFPILSSKVSKTSHPLSTPSSTTPSSTTPSSTPSTPSTPTPTPTPSAGEMKEKNLMEMFSPVKDDLMEDVIYDVKPKEEFIPVISNKEKLKTKDKRISSLESKLLTTNTISTNVTNERKFESPPLVISKENKRPMTIFTNISDTIKEKQQKFTQDNGITNHFAKMITNDTDDTNDTNDTNEEKVEKMQDDNKRDLSNNELLSIGTMDELKTRIVSKVKETIGVKKLSIINGESGLSGLSNSYTSPKRVVAFTDNKVVTENQEIITTDEVRFATGPKKLQLNENNEDNEDKDNEDKDNEDNEDKDNEYKDNEFNEEEVKNINNTADTATNFQLQVIGNVVDECLQEFRISLRNDIQNMHLELLRQFHLQKTEMEMMFLKYCGETMSLREEIEKLREENQRLKMKL
ncbi:hypothetical protein Glove_393g13 [Diversispora epigaea]|uniref:Uncharacterized protein n=1 Tax=Diversispora epigaea TaxID=1348612 RepID=A0A397H632_9GLOM|nr:hypothetical protein Glove_393g13 [Diversispora epigaea]